ncbi:MAG: polyprenyl synthetase family protein [Candidatus Blackburnbacteria bacterium]|nr:polyprenyl synthetase family protein [Candidatus Blackburnbacteria bacterium]
MDYRQYFEPYAQEQNKFLKNFFRQKKTEARRAAPTIAPKMWEEFEIFIAGGKRMRGGLVRLGYESFGGKKLKNVVPVSAAIEINHCALLVHDDVIDRDTMRHGVPTIHTKYKAYHKKTYKKDDPQHYGDSMAICVGLMGIYEAIRLVADSDFNTERKSQAVEFMSRFLVDTIYGEALDVDLTYHKNLLEKDIININRLKTAWYTIVGPLGVGASLTGISPNKLKVLEEFGLPLGIAFQLQDDILGIFGDEKKTGKSTASDIKEGKNTLLYLYALKKGTPKQIQQLKRLWGKKDIGSTEAKEVRQIIVDSGSLKYCQKRARKLGDVAKLAIPKITRDKKLQKVYSKLVDFVVQRER